MVTRANPARINNKNKAERTMKNKTNNVKKAVIVLAAAAMLMLGLLGATTSGADARGLEREAATTRSETVPVEDYSFNFEQIKVVEGSDSDSGPLHAWPAGGCSGVVACNEFIAACVGAGGDYYPGTDNEFGQPTSGHCGPVTD